VPVLLSLTSRVAAEANAVAAMTATKIDHQAELELRHFALSFYGSTHQQTLKDAWKIA
jgi:hypothetical protein